MELLTSLGVNSSLAVQFVVFVVCYAALKYLLFDPYFAAFSERSNRTVGKTEMAERFLDETKELEKRFALKAQDVNERFRTTFERARLEAMGEYDRVVSDARRRAKDLLDQTNDRVTKEVTAARTQIQTDVKSIAELINQKLIGKDARS